METGPMSSEITCGTCHHELGLEKGKERQRKGTGAVMSCPARGKIFLQAGQFLAADVRISCLSRQKTSVSLLITSAMGSNDRSCLSSSVSA